jgi:hypothetical protein
MPRAAHHRDCDLPPRAAEDQSPVDFPQADRQLCKPSLTGYKSCFMEEVLRKHTIVGPRTAAVEGFLFPRRDLLQAAAAEFSTVQ